MLLTTLLDIKLPILLHNIVLLISKLFLQSYMAMQKLPLYKAGRIRYMEVAIIQSDITTIDIKSTTYSFRLLSSQTSLL